MTGGTKRANWLGALLALALPVIALAAVEPPSNERETLMRKGIEQRLAGSYKSAIETFQQVLKLNERDSAALFEIANSYLGIGDLRNCVTFAGQSIEVQPSADGYNLLGSCREEIGDKIAALGTFEKGLARYPGDVALNLSYAASLGRQHRAHEAKQHLQLAILADPTYAPPYLTYAGVLAGENNAVGALYMWMRFLMLEPGSQRSRAVALYVKELLVPTTSAKPGKRMTIRLSTGNEEREDFPTNPRIPAFTLQVARPADEDKAASQFVSNGQLMLAVILDSTKKDTPRDFQTFVWLNAGAQLTALETAKLRETFLYYVAGLARLKGASDWLDAHPKEFEGLKLELAKRT